MSHWQHRRRLLHQHQHLQHRSRIVKHRLHGQTMWLWRPSLLCTVHASWLQQRDCRIKQLLTVTGLVTAAANAAIESITRVIRDNVADLLQQLQRACVGDLQEQARLQANVEVAVATPDAAISVCSDA